MMGLLITVNIESTASSSGEVERQVLSGDQWQDPSDIKPFKLDIKNKVLSPPHPEGGWELEQPSRESGHFAPAWQSSRSVWTVLLRHRVWLMTLSCAGPGVGLDNPWEFLLTQGILWFCNMICIRVINELFLVFKVCLSSLIFSLLREQQKWPTKKKQRYKFQS